MSTSSTLRFRNRTRSAPILLHLAVSVCLSAVSPEIATCQTSAEAAPPVGLAQPLANGAVVPPAPTVSPINLPIPRVVETLEFFKSESLPAIYRPALLALKENSPEQATALLDKVPPRAPHQEWVGALKSLAALMERNSSTALTQADRALKVRASSSDILFIKALCLLTAERWAEAETSAKEALWFSRSQLVPLSELHYLRAVALARMAELPQATKALEAASAASPPAILAQSGLSALATSRTDRAAAVRFARSAVQQRPDDVTAQMQLVRALTVKADPLLDRAAIAEADRLSEKIMDSLDNSDQKFNEAITLRTQTLLVAGKPELAEKVLAPLLKAKEVDSEHQLLASQVNIEKSAKLAREQSKAQSQLSKGKTAT